MLLAEELPKFTPAKKALVTIGVYDGVHLGHQYLLTQLKQAARDQGLCSVAVTFREHPLKVISPKTASC